MHGPVAGTVRAMLRLAPEAHRLLVAHCLDGLPEEACGLLAGPDVGAGAPDVTATRCLPTGNEAASTRVYTIPSRDLLRADRAADDEGLVLLGAFHSHTHTEAFPSPTDVRQAPDPTWRYVIVSLARPVPVVRSFRIVEGTVTEEPVVVG